MGKRCHRNRNRSTRRAIYCLNHGCYIDSVSQKYPLFADRAGQLQERGMSRRSAVILLHNNATVLLEGEWLEAFWCEQCQQTKWYRIRKVDKHRYIPSIAPRELWLQVDGVAYPLGNAFVGEFTRRKAAGLRI
ncbi:hypothetical protein [Mastigocoleus sp. MO_188.B34]|uniref:hypothetical protein n=1 Tax=Mastigocoleus sp. MO_188.B34 TaxID=3036635 RepID=UPI00261D95B2|nr:hypothetical protein [Mastigocoleus sp. MO_188.B34]MDJ0696287.1 hypothetical protein [Mastigocoleus sp. MO_188.B34]